MPIQFNLPAAKNNVGVDLPEAYAVITAANFGVQSSQLGSAEKFDQMTVKVYASAAAFASKKTTVLELTESIPAGHLTSTGQAYEYIKTLPLFAGAVTVA